MEFLATDSVPPPPRLGRLPRVLYTKPGAWLGPSKSPSPIGEVFGPESFAECQVVNPLKRRQGPIMSNSNRSKHYPQQNWRQPQPPSFGQPDIVGYMSVDGERRYHSDLSELKFVIKPPKAPVEWDLNHNIDQSWRGKETVHIAAALFDGCIYLCTLDTPEEALCRQNMTPEHKTMCTWGYKFQEMMLSDLPNSAPDNDSPEVENAEFYLFFNNTFGSHRLLYGAQIRGCAATSNTPPPPPNANYRANIQYLRDRKFIELKTNKLITNERLEFNYKWHKLLSGWAQCMVAGNLGLVVGLRDDQGIVRDFDFFNTEQIPEYCRDRWTPEEPLSFLNDFLNYVKNHFREELRRVGCDDVTRVGPITAKFEIQTDRDRTITVGPCEPILPLWYVEGRRQQTRR